MLSCTPRLLLSAVLLSLYLPQINSQLEKEQNIVMMSFPVFSEISDIPCLTQGQGRHQCPSQR
ncbi:hypothetical protein TYRP_000222 [Tyrophagus putrescentiae]|nr:hypothetical protein TYRP_000222 [Tyrophagus putrescentiae]